MSTVESRALPDLPSYMSRIRAHLLAERGMADEKATSVAIATAILFCKSGRSPNLPVFVNAASRAEACEAVAELEANRAAWKAKRAAERRELDDLPDLLIEERSAPADAPPRIEGNKLCGVIPYNVESRDFGGWNEILMPGCLANADLSNLIVTQEHAKGSILGRYPTTLHIEDRDDGLHWECELPNGPTGQDVKEAVKRGDLNAGSWQMVVSKDRWEGDTRYVEQISELRDVSAVALSGYAPEHAAVELRAHHPVPRPRPPKEAPEMKVEEIEKVEVEERTAPRGEGGLTVEERTISPEQERDVEERVLDALAGVMKGENRALTTTSAAAVAPPELSTFLFDKMRPASVLLSSGIRVIATDRDSIQWPKITGDVTPGWTSEGAAITPSDPTFATLTATPRKLAALVQFSNEVISDSNPAVLDVMRGHVSTILALRLDLAAFEGSGTAPEIRGIKNVAGIQTLSMGTNGAAITNLDTLSDAVGLLEAVNANAGAIVMPPRTWNVIRKLKDTQNRPLVGDSVTTEPRRSIFGVPVYLTSQLSITETQGTSNLASSIYVYDPSEVVLVRRTEAELEYDRSRLFNSDQSELRGKLRVDVLAPNPTAIVRVLGVL